MSDEKDDSISSYLSSYQQVNWQHAKEGKTCKGKCYKKKRNCSKRNRENNLFVQTTTI